MIGIVGGSLTTVAEFVRGTLMAAIEAYSLLVLRKIHRGRMTEFDFGTGKLERMCNLGIAAGMIGGALWIAHNAVDLAIQGHSGASPLGLALAACIGGVNTLVNYIAWLSLREAAAPAAPSSCRPSSRPGSRSSSRLASCSSP